VRPPCSPFEEGGILGPAPPAQSQRTRPGDDDATAVASTLAGGEVFTNRLPVALIAALLTATILSVATGTDFSAEPAGRSKVQLGQDTLGAGFAFQLRNQLRDSRAQLIALGAVGFLQTLLIGWLLIEHRQRRRAELEVTRRLQETRAQLVTITHLDRRAVVGEVTAAITHELNQPLEAILHNAEAGELMLESGLASPEELRCVFADIRRIDERAAEIIQRLHALLRKKEFETRQLDVNELTRETAALVTPVAGSKGVQVELELATDAPPIAGDPIHLQQVLLNVLLNGIEAMCTTPRERRQLAVRTMTVDHHVEISVRDCGHGIRAETVSQIFEPFYTTKGKGMGIGLSIARTIVEAHGGQIAAQNNADGGATVSFMLPSSGVA
jgi:C4-dicarboxylate-specific signal transduction histidine kinase